MNKIKINYTVLERLSRIISHLEKRLTCAGATSASDCDGSLDSELLEPLESELTRTEATPLALAVAVAL